MDTVSWSMFQPVPFMMGDNVGDGESRERPVHRVELDAFYIGKYEVTNAQFRKFRDDPAYEDPKLWPNGRPMPKDQIPYWTQANNHGGGTPGSDNYPVIGVNWDGAAALLQMDQRKDGEELSPAHRGGMGEGGARHGSTPLSVGEHDRPRSCELCRVATVRYGSRGRLL